MENNNKKNPTPSMGTKIDTQVHILRCFVVTQVYPTSQYYIFFPPLFIMKIQANFEKE